MTIQMSEAGPAAAGMAAVRCDKICLTSEMAMSFCCFFSSRRRHTRFDCETCALPISLHAVARSALFVRRQRQNQIARRTHAGALHRQKSHDERGVVALHILRSAPVKIAVLLAEFECDRKSVVQGKCVDIGGSRIIENK